MVAWIDANAPYHDGFANKRPRQAAYDLAGDEDLRQRLIALHAERCSACHKVDEVVRLDWISALDPKQSLMLTAPLARLAGGTGACGKAVYANRDDPQYQAVAGVIETAVLKAMDKPRRDLKALLGWQSTSAEENRSQEELSNAGEPH